jgi:predicted outer membrane repeat protein
MTTPDLFLEGLVVIPIPKIVDWPSENNFLNTILTIYDWDHFILQPNLQNLLKYELNLCRGGLPCSLLIIGQDQSSLQLSPQGRLICLNTDGCTDISIQATEILCPESETNSSFITISGADLSLFNTTVRGCRVRSDGGVVQAFKSSTVITADSVFENILSRGLGGVFSVVGSSLKVSASRFSNCSSRMGGAISAIDYQCSRSSPMLSNLQIYSSDFVNCHSEESGGALSISSGLALIVESSFTACRATISGGSVFAAQGSENVEIIVTDSFFEGNDAKLSGGGAIHTKNISATVAGSTCTRNSAANGGGGAVLWEGLEAVLTCGAGAYATDKKYECALCSAGKYQSGIRMTSNMSCLNCSAGSFSSSAGASLCALCEAGKYSDGPGAKSAATCIKCNVGKYQTGYGMNRELDCVLCPGGSFSNKLGASACLLCEAGSFSKVEGSISSCSYFCGPGSFSSLGASLCNLCHAGTYSTGFDTAVF